MAQLVENRAVMRKDVSSTPAGPTLRVCLSNDICKWLNSLVLADNDDKPSHNPSMFINLWDIKEPTHCSQRVGPVVAGVVVCPLWYIMVA